MQLVQSGPWSKFPAWTTLVAPLIRLVRPYDFRRADECRRVLQWLNAGPRERILDVGCGDGFYDRTMALCGARVDAIDANPDRAALGARRNPHPSITYQHMAAGSLRFGDASFDKVVSICVLEHIPDDAQALREMHRVLRPGGRFVLSCDSLSNRGIGNGLRRRHAERYAVHRFYTRESLYDRLRAAGFEPVRSTFIVTTPLSLAITRITYRADDLGKLPGGWILKYPVAALAGTVGLALSRLSERLAARNDEGLTLVAEAVRAESAVSRTSH